MRVREERRGRRIGVTATGLAMALLVIFPGVAAAHYVYQKGTVATYGSGACVQARAEVSHGSGGGYTKADVESTRTTSYGNISCIEPNPKPAGYLATRYDFYKWDSSAGHWKVCRTADWYYSKAQTGQYSIYTDFGVSPPCGHGYYGSTAYSYVKDNNTWYGGSIWSGYHSLPDSP